MRPRSVACFTSAARHAMWWLLRIAKVTTPWAAMRSQAIPIAFSTSHRPGRYWPSQTRVAPVSFSIREAHRTAP